MKTTIISIVIAVGIVIAAFLYFVSGVSATYAPIKVYKCLGSSTQLITAINNYTITEPGVIFKVTDTTGNRTDGYAFYVRVEINNIEYNLKWTDLSSNETKVMLVVAYDKKRKIGGYCKNAKDVGELAQQFQLTFLKPFEKKQKIKFTEL